MQPTAPLSAASPIPLPAIDSDEPVAVIPIASVAPLEGPPDGERINTFAIAPKSDAFEDFGGNALRDLRASSLRQPLIWMAAAVSLGLLIARARR